METVGLKVSLDGASKFVTDSNKVAEAITKVKTAAGQVSGGFASINTATAGFATKMTDAAKTTGILTASQVKAALATSDLKNKTNESGTAFQKVNPAVIEASTNQSKLGMAYQESIVKASQASLRVTEASNAIQKAGRDSSTTAEEHQKLNLAYQQAVIDAGRANQAVKENGQALQNSQQPARNASNAFHEIGSAIRDAASNIKDFAGDAAGRAIGLLGDLGGAALDAAGKVAGVGLSFVEAGVKMGINFAKSSVGVASDFESAMLVIQATSDSSASDMKKLNDAAIALGIQFPVSTTDVANGFGELTKAGFSANEVLASGTGLIKLGVAANLDNATSAEILAGSIRGFGLSAGDANRVVDILATTANASSVDITDLGQTFKYAAPAARALGFSLEDVSIASGILGNNMIKGSSAGTGLATIFTRLAAPPKDAAAAIEVLGLKIAGTDGKVRPLRDIIGDLRAKFQGLSQVEQLDLAKKLAGQDAAKSLLSIINASTEDWNGMTKAIDNAGGSADKMATIMSSGTKGALDNLGGSVEALQIRLGQQLGPAINYVAGQLAGFVNTITTAMSEIGMGLNNKVYQQGAEKMTTPFIEFGQTLRTTVLPALAKVGDFFFGTIIPAAGQIAMVLLTQVIPGVISFAVQLGTFLAPIISQVAGFIVNDLIPGVMNFARAAAPVVISAIQGIGQFIQTVLIPAAVGVVNYWQTSLVPAFQTASNWIQANLVPVFVSLANTFTGTVLPAIIGFGQFIQADLLPKLQSFADWFGVTIMPVISQFIAFIANPLIPTLGAIAAVILDTVIPTITNWVGVIATFLTPIITALVDFISGTVIPVMGNIATFIGGTVVPAFQQIGSFINTNVMPVLTTLAGFLGGALTVAFQNIGTVIGGVWEGIKTAISTAWNVISGIFNIIKSVLSGDFGGAWTALKTLIGQVWDGITTFISNSWNTAKGVIDNIINFVGGPFKAAWDGLKTAVETVWNGIGAAVASGKSVLDPIFEGIKIAIGAVQKVWDGLLEAVKKGADVIGKVAKGDWAGAWDALTGKATEGATTTISEIDKIGTAIANKDYSASARKAGATIGAGMAQGIQGAAQSVAAAAANIAQQAINAAKSRLSSASPSKVFMQIGRDISDGLGLGIANNQVLATEPMNRVVTSIITTTEDKHSLIELAINRFLQPILEMGQFINNLIGSKDDPASPLYILLETLWRITDDAGHRMTEKTDAFVGTIVKMHDDIQTVIGSVKDPAAAVGAVLDGIAQTVDLKSVIILGQFKALVSGVVNMADQIKTAIGTIPKTAETGSLLPMPGGGSGKPGDPGLSHSFASGTRSAPAGLAIVGEKGPELVDNAGRLFLAAMPRVVNLSAGAQVYDAATTSRLINPPASPTSYHYNNSRTSNVTNNMPIYTNQSPAVIQQGLNIVSVMAG